MAGHNTANWRAAGTRFRENVLAKLDTIVTMTPDMSVTAMYSDYVLPVAHHYERQDFVMEGRTPYIQVLDRAVPPLGESEDDWHDHGAPGEGHQREGGARASCRRSRTCSTASRSSTTTARCTSCSR